MSSPSLNFPGQIPLLYQLNRFRQTTTATENRQTKSATRSCLFVDSMNSDSTLLEMLQVRKTVEDIGMNRFRIPMVFTLEVDMIISFKKIVSFINKWWFLKVGVIPFSQSYPTIFPTIEMHSLLLASKLAFFSAT